RYESLLSLPNVGLALDPEWRLAPDEVHLQQIGSVTAAEVNEVVKLLPPLVVTDEAIDRALEILDEVADSINDQMVDDLRREEVAS
ncbi:MAG TPA: hypothetical protein VGE43_11250, partial [Acidimicrobiales bacterium]